MAKFENLKDLPVKDFLRNTLGWTLADGFFFKEHKTMAQAWEFCDDPHRLLWILDRAEVQSCKAALKSAFVRALNEVPVWLGMPISDFLKDQRVTKLLEDSRILLSRKDDTPNYSRGLLSYASAWRAVAAVEESDYTTAVTRIGDVAEFSYPLDVAELRRADAKIALARLMRKIINNPFA